MSEPNQELDSYSQIVVTRIRNAFPEAIQQVITFRGELTIVVDRQALADVCTLLRDEPGLGFNYLADLTGVDMLPEHPRFEVNVHLLALHPNPRAGEVEPQLSAGGPGAHGASAGAASGGTTSAPMGQHGRGTRRLRVKVRLEEHDAHVPTLTSVWPAAAWYEREIHELFGIGFDGHPDMRYLLLAEDWEGPPPLRRDVPVKVEEVAFSFNQRRIYAKKPFARE